VSGAVARARVRAGRRAAARPRQPRRLRRGRAQARDRARAAKGDSRPRPARSRTPRADARSWPWTAPAGAVARWRDWTYWTADFSSLQREGEFRCRLHDRRRRRASSLLRIENGRARAADPLRRPLLLQGPARLGPPRSGDRRVPARGPERPRGGRARGWYDATGDYGTAPLAPVVFDVLQPAADSPDGLGPARRRYDSAAPLGPALPPVPAAAARRGGLGSGLPRARAGPGRLVLPLGVGARDRQAAEDRRIGRTRRAGRQGNEDQPAFAGGARRRS
jgi:hypothetical protein